MQKPSRESTAVFPATYGTRICTSWNVAGIDGYLPCNLFGRILNSLQRKTFGNRRLSSPLPPFSGTLRRGPKSFTSKRSPQNRRGGDGYRFGSFTSKITRRPSGCVLPANPHPAPPFCRSPRSSAGPRAAPLSPPTASPRPSAVRRPSRPRLPLGAASLGALTGLLSKKLQNCHPALTAARADYCQGSF